MTIQVRSFEDTYTCLGVCNPNGCRGHEGKLTIVDDMYFFYHDDRLIAGGPIEELNLLGSLMMEAGDAGVI